MLAGCTPWPEEYQRRYREAGYWEDITLWRMFEESAAKTPDSIALVFGDQRISYGELKRRINRLASAFSKMGLKNRDRVIFQFILHFLNMLQILMILIGYHYN